MTWEKLQKPYIGLHWWYRLITGREYTYPVIEQDGYKIYWKYLKEPQIIDGKRVDIKVECKLLNLLSFIQFRVKDIKNIFIR